MGKAVERFQQATARDPDQALLWAGLAQALYYQSDFGAATPREVMPRAKQAAEKAVELDPKSAEAHIALGLVRLTWDLQWADAEREFRLALSFSPGSAYGHDWRGESLWALGRLQEASSEFDAALAADPLSPIVILDTALNQSFQGRHSEAAAIIQRAIDLHPDVPVLYKNMACELAEMGDIERARHYLEIMPRNEAELFRLSSRICLDAAEHNTSDMRRLIPEWDRIMGSPERGALGRAELYSQIGDRAATKMWLERAYRSRDPEMFTLGLDDLFPASDPAYLEMLKRLQLPLRAAPAPVSRKH